MGAKSQEVKQIPRDRNAQLHFLLLKLLPALLTATVYIPACAYQHTNEPFYWAFPYPRVLWNGELLFYLGWVKILDLGPSWLL